MNKDQAIEFLQNLPAGEDAVVVIMTRNDANTMLADGQVLSDDGWQTVLKRMSRYWPSDEMWSDFSSIVCDVSDPINTEE